MSVRPSSASDEALIVDFAPHAVHYAGSWGERWFVSLLQYPLLLTLDAAGAIVGRVAIPDVERVVGGKVALRRSTPRVARANIARGEHVASVLVAHDLATGAEISREEAEVKARVDELGSSSDKLANFVDRDGGDLVWSAPGGSPQRFRIRENDRGGPRARYDWTDAHRQANAYVLAALSRFLLIPTDYRPEGELVARTVVPEIGELPLEPGTVFHASPERVLVEHATRGRLWIDRAASGLTKGDAVEIGGYRFVDRVTVATVLVREGRELFRGEPAGAVLPTANELVVFGDPAGEPAPEERPVSKTFVKMARVLAKLGFIDRGWLNRISELAEELDAEAPGLWTASEILETVYEEESGAAHGVVHHDHRFGNETDDVVAELTATLGDEPVTFAQVGTRELALQIEVGGHAHWVSFDRGGIDAVARFINLHLDKAGVRRRIFALTTRSDRSCHVVCTTADAEAMKRAGVGLKKP